MFGIDLIRRVPTKLITLIFYYILPVLLLIRFLVGTIRGTLLLSISIYWVMWNFCDPRPYTPASLILWIDDLPSESKTSVITTTITVLGFLIAFHTGTLNWKAQALAELKRHVASEIESFFTEASKLTFEAQMYSESLVTAVNLLQSQGPSKDSIFAVTQALKKSADFIETRDRLSALSVEIHRISGRHYSVLSTVWGATKALEDCASAFGEITEKMWLRIPSIIEGHPDPLSEFLLQINIKDCMEFSEICEINSDFMNANSGGIRGLLLAPIVGINFSSRMSLAGKEKMFTEAMQKIRKRK